MSQNKIYSVVIPVFNSEAFIGSTVSEVSDALASSHLDFEIVLVDDSSNDGSWEEMKKLKKEFSFLHLIRLGKNVGQFAAAFAGATKVKGDVVITFDDDMQYPAHEIPKLISFYEQGGFKWVYGVPITRKLTAKQKFYSFFIRRLVNLSTLKKYVPKGYFYSGFRAFDKSIMNHKSLNTQNIKALDTFAIWLFDPKHIGFLEVAHQNRKHNKSGQTFKKKFSDGLTAILSVIDAPYKFLWYFLPLFLLISFASLVLEMFISNYLLFVLLIIINFSCWWLLGIYLAKIYARISGKHDYHIIEEIE